MPCSRPFVELRCSGKGDAAGVGFRLRRNGIWISTREGWRRRRAFEPTAFDTSEVLEFPPPTTEGSKQNPAYPQATNRDRSLWKSANRKKALAVSPGKEGQKASEYRQDWLNFDSPHIMALFLAMCRRTQTSKWVFVTIFQQFDPYLPPKEGSPGSWKHSGMKEG
jgi:hypothetical protein